MTEIEFLKKMKDENLVLKDMSIVVNRGFITTVTERFGKFTGKTTFVYGCTKATNHGRKWFMYSSYYKDSEKNSTCESIKFVYDTDKRGREVKIVIPSNVIIYQEYNTETEAFDDFYRFIKESMKN